MFIVVKVPHQTINIDFLLLGPEDLMCHCIPRATQQRVLCRFHASLIRTLIGHDLS